MREDDFIGQQFHWFTGVVEDINDPESLNRVRVRCHGYHPVDQKLVNTKDLPWATVMMPSTSASVYTRHDGEESGIGANHHLEIGSFVVGFFRDGPSAQDPIVLGSIATSNMGSEDLPREASTDNKVYKSRVGHLIEIDNGVFTPGKAEIPAVEAEGPNLFNDFKDIAAADAIPAVPSTQAGETLRVTHVGGTVIEIDDKNNLTIYVEDGGDLHIGVKKGDTTIVTEEGDTSIQTGGDTTIISTGDTTITSTGKSDIISGQEVTITSAKKTTIV